MSKTADHGLGRSPTQAGWQAASTLLLGLLALLGACGGGGAGSPPAASTSVDPPVQGRLYPAVAGVVMGEYGADGQLIQTSSATLQDGSFTFPRALSGVRLSGTEAGSADIVPVVHSARLAAPSATWVEVTPLSTWYDQLLANGLAPAAARDRISELVRARCTVKGQAPDLGHLHADTLDTSDQHDWLLSALAAYLAAARSVGQGPGVDFEGWQGLLGRRAPVLAQLCEHAATVSGKDWRETVSAALSAPGGGQAPRAGTLDQALAEARSQVLALMAQRVQLLEYPDLATLLAVQRGADERPPLRLNQELAMALYRHLSAPPSPDSDPARDLASQAHPTLGADALLSYRLDASLAPQVLARARLQLINRGTSPRLLQLSINGRRLADLPELLAQIIALPVEFDGEPLYRKAWRYVVAHAQRSVPVAGGMFQHQPDLWLRSVGSSFCDAQAAVLYWIWTAMGYEARVVGLTGHVTAEVRVDGHWQVLDPYLQVSYLDRSGRPVGVAELEQDPTLITQPERPTRPLDDVAYSQVVADVFASTEDNFIQDRYMVPLPQAMAANWTLPAGARLEFLPGLTLTRPSTEPGATVDLASVRLWLPPGFSGTVPLPLLLVNASGEARITLLGRQLDPTRDDVKTLLDELYLRQVSNVGVTTLQVDQVGAEGLLLTLMLSPHYVQGIEGLSVEARGADLAGLVFSMGQTAETSH